MKQRVLKVAAVVAAIAGTVGLAAASGAGAGISADEALSKLFEGNKRYVDNQLNAGKLCDTASREALAKGQKPYAIILSCSDSRVPPEIIFDKGLGEIFVVRVAGNVADPIVLGSVEYAAEHLGSPLIMVLGHERCGAVTASVKAKGKPEGNIGAIVKTIEPAVAQAKKRAKGKVEGELVECAIEDNAKMVAASLPKKSPIISHLVKEGKVKVVAAKYDLDEGTVTLLK